VKPFHWWNFETIETYDSAFGNAYFSLEWPMTSESKAKAAPNAYAIRIKGHMVMDITQQISIIWAHPVPF
jgi:hypothetical protein